MTMSKWWVEAERWREIDAERDALPFTPRDYDEMLDEAAQIYARWRQGSEAETDPALQGPFQQSYVNALMFMPDVLEMVEAKGPATVRDIVDLAEAITPRARGFMPFNELTPDEQQILRDRFPGRFA